MTTAQICVDLSSIRERGRRPATGTIRLQLKDHAFPQHNWNDFVVVILCAWTTTLAQLVRRASKPELVHFMEGPFSVELARIDPRTIRIRALEGGKEVHAPCFAATSDLVDNAKAVAKAVLAHSKQRGRDWDQLAAALDLLTENAGGRPGV